MGGIIPNKEDAITPGLLWAVSFPGGTTYDLNDATSFGGLTERLNWRNQPNVIEFLKQQVKAMPEWVGAANSVFDGFRRGIPGGENVPLPLAIVEIFTGQILGLPAGTWSTVNDAIAGLVGIPGIPELAQLVTQIPGVVTDPRTTIATWAANLQSFLSGIDLNNPGLDMVTALENWVTTNVLPLIVVGIGDVTGLGAALAALAPIDTIMNALGVPGSGFGTTDLTTALTHIPGANLVSVAAGIVTGVLAGGNIPGLDASKIISGSFPQTMISGLAASLAALAPIDTLVNALGVTGTGHTITDLTTAMTHIPGANLVSVAAGIVTGVLAGGNIPGLDASKIISGTFTQTLIPSLTGGWGGTIASSLLSGVLGAGLIPGLDASKIITGQLAQARAAWAAPIDTLVQAWGGTGTGFLPADLITFASAIPHDNLTGNLGGSNIADTIQRLLDGGVKAVQNNPALTGQTIAQWNNAMGALMGFIGYNPAGATPPNSVAAITSNTDANLKARAVQNHPYENMDATINATFPFNDVSTLATLPTIAITQANPVSAPIRIRDAGQKQSIRWKGFTGATGTLTGFYVNLYHINETNGVKTWFYTAPEYHASLAVGTTPQWNSQNLAALAYINTTQGDLIDAEITITGTATYNIVGKTLSNQVLPLSGIFPSMIAATRVPPAPTFDQVGAGNAQGNVNSINISWNQPLGASANCILVGINQGASAYVAPVVKIGTNTFTQVGTTYNYATNQFLSWWSLFITPGALGTSASVNVTIAGTSANFVAANSVSCNGVGSIAAPVTFSGTGTAISQTLSSLVAPVEIMQLWGSNSVTTGAAFSAYSKNSKWNQPFLGNVDQATLIGETTVNSGTSVNITGTIQSSTYGSISLILSGMLQPAPATIANPVNPGSTTSAASPATYTRLQPWIGLAGTAGTTSYSPVIDAYATPGTGISIQNPAVKYPWANNFDIIVCSDGSGGEGGGYPVGGVGGKAGTFARQTLTRAQIGTSNLTLNIGGGSPGTGPGVGSSAPGSGVNVAVPGWGTVSQTGAPGSGSGLSPSAYGVPGDSSSGITYNDANGTPVTINGGSGGGSGGQAPGSQPGGGGSGGNATYMPNFGGGPGGAAEVWIRSYQ